MRKHTQESSFRYIRWMYGDKIDGYLGLAETGTYEILWYGDEWLAGWIPAEDTFAPPPRGKYIGHSETVAGCKAIAERDNERSCRRRAPTEGTGGNNG